MMFLDLRRVSSSLENTSFCSACAQTLRSRLQILALLDLSKRVPLQRAGSQEFSLKVLPMDVVDAEGLDLEQLGEDRTFG